MSITFVPTEGTTETFIYYGADDMDERPQSNGIVRFARDEPSCNAHNIGGYTILEALGLTRDCVGIIPNAMLADADALLSGPHWPNELERYRADMSAVVKCAIYHGCDVTWA
jgi:hypothetical protein